MINSSDHIVQRISRIVICGYCKGSGRIITCFRNDPNLKESMCPKCMGEGRFYRYIEIITRPITTADKVNFSKVINND